MAFIDAFKSQLQTRFDRFITKRMPSSDKQTLSQPNIFIFPTLFGFSYLLFCLLLFVLGTNYQNNLVVFVSFLLGSLFVVAMLHSFNNLSGITISASGKLYGFANQIIKVPLTLNAKSDKCSITLEFAFPMHTPTFVSHIEGEEIVPIKLEKEGFTRLDD